MSNVQRLMLSILPTRLSNAIKAESEGWRITCLTCGNSKSVWEVGGIRWGAASVGKRKLVQCSHCSCLRWASVDWKPDVGDAKHK